MCTEHRQGPPHPSQIYMHAYKFLEALEKHPKPCRENKRTAGAANMRKYRMELRGREKMWIGISTECYSEPALKGRVG